MTGRRLLVASVVLALAGLAGIFVAGLMLADGNGAAESTGASGTIEVPVRVTALEGEDPVTGEPVSLARVEKRTIVLTVWASWCASCVRGAPALAGFARKHRDRVAVVGLDLQDGPADARAFYERFDWAFPSISDPEGVLAAGLEIEDLPTTLFLDRDRLVVARVDGTATREELESALDEALGRG